MQIIRAQNPYELGLCTKTEIENAVEKYQQTHQTDETEQKD